MIDKRYPWKLANANACYFFYRSERNKKKSHRAIILLSDPEESESRLYFLFLLFTLALVYLVNSSITCSMKKQTILANSNMIATPRRILNRPCCFWSCAIVGFSYPWIFLSKESRRRGLCDRRELFIDPADLKLKELRARLINYSDIPIRLFDSWTRERDVTASNVYKRFAADRYRSRPFDTDRSDRRFSPFSPFTSLPFAHPL